jgi:hypothetical protein
VDDSLGYYILLTIRRSLTIWVIAIYKSIAIVIDPIGTLARIIALVFDASRIFRTVGVGTVKEPVEVIVSAVGAVVFRGAGRVIGTVGVVTVEQAVPVVVSAVWAVSVREVLNTIGWAATVRVIAVVIAIKVVVGSVVTLTRESAFRLGTFTGVWIAAVVLVSGPTGDNGEEAEQEWNWAGWVE